MARPAGSGRPTCEGCLSLDVREWARLGYLWPGRRFSLSLSWCDGEPADFSARTEPDAVILLSRRRVQRISITWTDCRFGGRRAWFRCTGYSAARCGRRVAKLYSDGGLFACRHCHGLAYASQQLCTRDRLISSARKIRMQLGGGPSLFDPFPDKPRGMHWRTYERLRARARASEAHSFSFLRYFRGSGP